MGSSDRTDSLDKMEERIETESDDKENGEDDNGSEDKESVRQLPKAAGKSDKKEAITQEAGVNAREKPASADIDSDDDLEPFDMSHDKQSSRIKPPAYIRDCLDGLIATEQPDRTAICLQTAEQLVRNEREFIDPQVAVELTKVLLHLNDEYDLPGFVVHRRRALVATAVRFPKRVADYLTRQFYERNYNLRQRMDVLEVLAAAAQELSQPGSPPLAAGASGEGQSRVISSSSSEAVPLSPGPTTENWRALIEQRLERKTRRFSKDLAAEDVAGSLPSSAPKGLLCNQDVVPYLRPTASDNNGEMCDVKLHRGSDDNADAKTRHGNGPNVTVKTLLCCLRTGTVTTSLLTSITNLLGVTVDRYIAVIMSLRYPMIMTHTPRRRRHRRLLGVVAVVQLRLCDSGPRVP
ncbi:PREDICTED: telomere length regulation protein TEL2 homolog [Priapulus caudatus]|uniref:Telomere length regulation protein TEL2 homolog n=1 Tax=Priapulus caudatus TaxID=37621 RepID=A0ABM1DT57_PRICU|nr:PREDICTED: telomere length regulation protein TEL2 homolog [Priapulus caudatus]